MTAALNLPGKQEWTVDDLADLPKDLRYELIDGRLILPSPLPFHQNVAAHLLVALERNSPADMFITQDQSVAVNGRNEPRPDVVAVTRDGADRTPVLAQDVALVVEIVSPESAIRDHHEKPRIYALAGIPAYWIIDPLHERVGFTEFLLGDDGRYRRGLQTDALVTITRPWDTVLDLPGWTSRRDGLRRAALTKD